MSTTRKARPEDIDRFLSLHSPLTAADPDITELVRRTLHEAVQAFAADPLVESTLGTTLRQEFITYKEQEWTDYHLRVSQWEIDQYARLY